MADYWKSQDRKYCDFCKCWIADNKPSVEFHEKGRRHQENVKKRVRTIQRNSAKAQRENDRLEANIKQMETAALAAYKKDVANNANVDLTSINLKKEANRKIWQEAKAKDGKTYYWNVVTNETVWTPPKEGYLSLKEQKDLSDAQTQKELKEIEKQQRIQGLQMVQAQKAQEQEERARLAREKLKERRVMEDSPEPTYGPILEPGKIDPYGGWQTIKKTENVDLQLPQQDYYDYQVPEIEPEPTVKEFKEKTVESLVMEGGSGSFKKRKIISGAKRNTRQRLEDD